MLMLARQDAQTTAAKLTVLPNRNGQDGEVHCFRVRNIQRLVLVWLYIFSSAWWYFNECSDWNSTVLKKKKHWCGRVVLGPGETMKYNPVWVTDLESEDWSFQSTAQLWIILRRDFTTMESYPSSKHFNLSGADGRVNGKITPFILQGNLPRMCACTYFIIWYFIFQTKLVFGWCVKIIVFVMSTRVYSKLLSLQYDAIHKKYHLVLKMLKHNSISSNGNYCKCQ